MPIEWPNTLPSALNADGAEWALGDNTLRSQTDVGPAKLRRRSTAMPDTFAATQVITTAQVGHLVTFYKSTTAGGSLAFDWTHPVTGGSVSMVFRGPPRFTPVGGDYWRAEYQFEILP